MLFFNTIRKIRIFTFFKFILYICNINIKNAIENNRGIYILMPEDYKASNTSSSDYGSFLYSHAVKAIETVDLLHNTVMDDDFAFAIGSFAILMSMEGELEVIDQNKGVCIRTTFALSFVGFF